MSSIKAAFFSVTVIIVYVQINGQLANQLVNPDCLDCICDASSQCNVSIGCFQPSPGSYFCGPFGISKDYWTDAGKPVIRDDNPEVNGAFETCVNDLYCAAETVHRYMKKFSGEGDCNGDGAVDCADFALMHSLGGYACNTTESTTTDFYKNFEVCWDKVKPPTVNSTGST